MTLVLPLAVATLALGGCASSSGAAAPSTSSGAAAPSSSPAPTPSASSPDDTPAQGKGVTLEVTVVGKKVTPPPATVDARPGEQVTLTLTTDRSSELHIHAADPELETEITPGTQTYTFTLTSQPGVYEAELHDPDLLLFEIKVQ